MVHEILLFAIGVLISGLGTIIGFGGGVFLVPILVAYGVGIKTAITLALMAVFPAALISTAINLRKKNVDINLGLLFEAPVVVGTIIGAWLTQFLDYTQLKLVFAAFTILLGITLLKNTGGSSSLKKLAKTKPIVNGVSLTATTIYGTSAGISSGLLGIGGGFLKTPVLMHAFGLEPKRAVATALFMIAITSAIGFSAHYLIKPIDSSLALTITTSFALGAIIANKIDAKVSQGLRKKMIAGGLILAGAMTLI